MKRDLRLTKSTDFKRVRLSGKSFAHPLVVLLILSNPGGNVRVGVSAGRSVGNAVVRNRAKRRLRVSVTNRISEFPEGWDLVLLARAPIRNASFEQIDQAVKTVLERTGLCVLARIDT